MPVCRLLRVHSTGLTTSHRREPRQQLLEQHPQLQPGQVGAEAVVDALAEAQVRVGLTGDVEVVGVVEHRGVAVGRALPDQHLLPGRDRRSRRARRRAVAVRRFDGDGDVQRTISSIAVGSSVEIRHAAAANWSGCSASASSPPATALRVVSAPALNSRLKNRYSSMSDSAARRRRPASRSRRPTACRRSARPASTRSAPGRRCTSASRLPRPTAARWTPCASRRSRTAARWPRTANAVRTPALPAECRSSASAARRRRRPGSRTARPARPHRAAAGRATRRSSSTRRIIRGVRPGTDQPADLRVPRVVHHVEHLTRDRQVLQQRAAERPRAAGHRRVRLRITQHRKRFRVGGDRPEALAVGRVLGRLVPVHRRLAAMHRRTGRAGNPRRSCPDR